MTTLERILYWVVRLGAYALPFTLLIVADSLFFPFISGKNFAFRIIVELMAASWAGLLILNFKKYWPGWNLLSIAFTLFVSAIFVSAYFGVDFSQSFWSNYERMDGVITQIHLLALFFVLAGTFRTRREWFGMLGVSMFAGFLIAFYGVLEYYGVINTVADSSRIISTLGNPLYVAAYLSFNIFLLAYFLTEVRSTAARWFLGAVLLFELGAFFLTSARGAFLGILVGTGLIFLLSAFSVEGAKKKIILSSIIVILVLIPVLLSVFKDVSFIENNAALSRYSNITLESGRARLTIWNMALEAFKERPIMGWGFENFITAFGKYYDPKMFGQEPWFDRTHNMPLEWLFSGGVIGFSAYAFLLISVIWVIRRSVKNGTLQKNQAFIFVGMLIAYLVQLLFVFDTLATYLMFVFVAGFFSVASSSSEEWSMKNSLNRFNIKKQVKNVQTKISALGYIGLALIFAVAVATIITVDIRPLIANRSLMNAIILFNDGKLSEARENFTKALDLSKGTIGVAEAREHLAFNAYNLFSSPALLNSPDGKAFYDLTKEELEKQIADDSAKYLNVKHNILLAQLYHQRYEFDRDSEALSNAFRHYNIAMEYAPNYINIYPIYANLLAETGKIENAITVIDKVSQLLIYAGGYDPKIIYSKPLFYTALKRYDEAYASLMAINQKYGNHSSGSKLDPEMMQSIIGQTGSHGVDATPFLEKIVNYDEK